MTPVELLQRMLEIESLSGQERALAEFLVEAMKSFGFDNAFIDDAGNAVGLRGSKGDGRDIVLLGHMDTVPGRIPVRIEGDSLYGRGSVDAKGPLATFIIAAAQAKIPAGTRLIVVGAVEEEAPSSKGARFARDQYNSPEACIIGEPSGWDAVTLGYKGCLTVEYRLTQPGGHSAGPVGGVAEQAVAWWQALLDHAAEYNRGHQRLFDQLLPSLRRINSSSDGMQDTIEATVGFRLPPRFDIDALEQFVRTSAGPAEVKFIGREVAWESSRESELARAFVRVIRDAGARPSFKLKTGTSDMNVVGPKWNCPIVAYGPGDSKLDHTPSEHVSIREFHAAIDVLTRVLESL
jgi:LysW-gamma-L-lysine carboxypeptidase